MQNIPRNIIYIAVGGFLWLMALAIYFASDRIMFSDMAYQEIYILFEKKPLYNWSRPGSTLLQLVPLFLQKMNVSLQGIVNIHSVSFVVYNFIGFLIITYYQKRIEVALALLFCMVLFMQHSFFWCQSEYQQGFVFLGFYAAYLANNLSVSSLKNKIFLLISVLFNSWIMTYHPLIIFPLLFVLFYYCFKINLIGFKNFLLLLFPFAIGVLSRVVIGFFNPYEAGKMGVLRTIADALKNIATLPSVQSFFSLSYLPFFILVATCSYVLIKEKKYVLLFLFIGFLTGYIGLILTTHTEAISHYSESMLLVVGFVVGLVFIDMVTPKISFTLTAIVILLVMIHSSALTLSNSRYTARIQYLRELIAQHTSQEHPKVVLSAQKTDEKKLVTHWATSYESVLLTAAADPANIRELMVVNDPSKFMWMRDMDSSYAAIYSVYGRSSYPEDYIRLPDSAYLFVY